MVFSWRALTRDSLVGFVKHFESIKSSFLHFRFEFNKVYLLESRCNVPTNNQRFKPEKLETHIR